jgi:hypothetical protein
MVLYNVTVSVDSDIHEEWLQWMKTVHIPEVLNTGMFTENRICKVDGFEEGGVTYAVMYLAPDREHYNRYQSEFAPALQQSHTQRYGQRAVAFRTVLDVLHQTTR